MSTHRPYLSVIVPAHQGESVLPQSLGALAASDLPRDDWELIVVDDASTDETPLVAARTADTIVRLAGRPRGPAYARNRGFEASRGEVVAFVDADVCVHRETLRRLVDVFRTAPDVAAVFGSYDMQPPGAGVVSQFRNLMHHYVHQCNAGEAETFWAGCGAVRAPIFAGVGMFDEWHYARPQIEDIELGRRLRQHGHRIQLRPEIQGTHLKRWSLRNMLATDLKHRGVPWMWLLLKEGPSAGARSLNVKSVEKWCTALVGLALLGSLLALFLWSAWPLLASAFAVLAVLLLNRRFYGYLRRHRNTRFAMQAAALHLLCYVVNGFSVFSGSMMHLLFGEPVPPVDVTAQADLGIKTWPPGPVRPARSMWDHRPLDAERPAGDSAPGVTSGPQARSTFGVRT
jgi:glycosyltransferase involved in cell wall biosynthesis